MYFHFLGTDLKFNSNCLKHALMIFSNYHSAVIVKNLNNFVNSGKERYNNNTVNFNDTVIRFFFCKTKKNPVNENA